ncbi:MAG: AI-2E family transporter [Eubacterium sp.]|nr:AI-2E family transporter [Eubacterium sp.]
MNKLRDKLDPKYTKICIYAGITVISIVVILMLLGFSGPFWQTLWMMFTAILKPIIIGGIICYLFFPIVQKIENMLSKEDKPWRRPAAVAIFYVSVAVILLLAILVLFFALKGSITEGLKNIDLEAIKDFVLMLKDRFADQLESLQQKLAETELPIGKAGDLFAGFLNAVTGFFSGLLFGVIFSVYFMLDGQNIMTYWKRAFRLVAGDKVNDEVERFIKDADKVFSGYIRGQFLDAFLVGVISTIALTLGGVPYAAVVGVLIGIGNLIPYVGPVVGYAAVAVICIAMAQFDKLVIGIAIIAVVMFVDGNIINPRLLSDNVEVHPLLVVAALLAGGAIGGFVGMLVAVPVAALLKLQFDRYLERKEEGE